MAANKTSYPCPHGNADREASSLPPDRDRIHGIIPLQRARRHRQHIGLSVSGINMAYNTSAAIGVGDADILISPEAQSCPDR